MALDEVSAAIPRDAVARNIRLTWSAPFARSGAADGSDFFHFSRYCMISVQLFSHSSGNCLGEKRRSQLGVPCAESSTHLRPTAFFVVIQNFGLSFLLGEPSQTKTTK